MPDSTTQRTEMKHSKGNVTTFPLPETIPYDLPMLDKFIHTVFKRKNLDENILTWSVNAGSNPAFPVSDSTLRNKLKATGPAKAYYYGTSTCAKEEGKLRNRFALFQGLYVIVLDDIGTKVSMEKFEGVTPTYAIESSAGNYQYGFVLKEPIRDAEHAKSFIRAVYASGYTDDGGAMPTKLVRLPIGVNGKKGDKQGFHVELKQWNPKKLWGYDELLDALKVPYTYDQIKNDTNLFRKARTLGASAWANVDAKGESANNLVDPVLEWLYQENQVVSETGEWVTIRCPWWHDHTSGDDLAGYKPLGRGDDPTSRAFHCFHGHCAGHKTMDFLEHVKREADIEASPRDMAAVLVRDWVFDTAAGGVWNVTNPDHIVFSKLANFKELFARKVWVPAAKGKVKAVAQHHLWTHAPNRLSISGCKPFIGQTELFADEGGHVYLNSYQAPEWGDGGFDVEDVNRFLSFIEYLIPEENDRYYFLNWLIAKIQDPCFRGAAIVMVAELQGVGRSTLGDMIGTLIGHENKAQVNFDKLLTATTFNEWATKPIVISDETLATQPNSPKFNSAYEALKDFVDPRPKRIEINPKYGVKFEHTMVTSFLLFSNHRAAMSVPQEDRRLYVLNNALVPASSDYFTELNDWLKGEDYDGKPKWARSVYRWMMKQEVDMELLLSPPEMTAAKAEMQGEVASGIDVICNAIEASVGVDGIVRIGDWEGVARSLMHRVTSMGTEDAMQVFRKIMQARSVPFRDNRVVSTFVNGEKASRRPRLFKKALAKAGKWTPHVRTPRIADGERAELKSAFVAQLENMPAHKAELEDYLEAKDL